MSNCIKYEVRVYPNGDKFWYLGEERHNEHGPAIEYANGDKAFYLKDCLYAPESAYKSEMARREKTNTCAGQVRI